MAMKIIYLVCHAESTAQSGESADDINPVLSKKGEGQAEALREKFDGLLFGKVYLSPLLRVWMTFKLSGVQCRQEVVTSLLAEDPFGREKYYADLIESPDPAIFPGDEDYAWYDDGRTRAKRLLSKILKEKVNTIACFGHWGIFNQVLQVFLGYEEDLYRRRAMVDNCHICKLSIEPDGSRIVNYWNRPTVD